MLKVRFPVRWSNLAVAEEEMLLGMMLDTKWWKLPKPPPPMLLGSPCISIPPAEDIAAPLTMSIMLGMLEPPSMRT